MGLKTRLTTRSIHPSMVWLYLPKRTGRFTGVKNAPDDAINPSFDGVTNVYVLNSKVRKCFSKNLRVAKLSTWKARQSLPCPTRCPAKGYIHYFHAQLVRLSRPSWDCCVPFGPQSLRGRDSHQFSGFRSSLRCRRSVATLPTPPPTNLVSDIQLI